MKKSREICKPILFSTPMVQAILRGEKTQTRREVKYWKKITNPKIVGDILWVRETWQHTKALNLHISDENHGYVYKADGEPWEDYENWKWKPSIFMPKDACRIFLKITKIRIERLEDITKEDAIAEGIEKWENCNSTGGVHPAIASFRSLWTSINGFDNLNSNPWVFVYDFERTNTSVCDNYKPTSKTDYDCINCGNTIQDHF